MSLADDIIKDESRRMAQEIPDLLVRELSRYEHLLNNPKEWRRPGPFENITSLEEAEEMQLTPEDVEALHLDFIQEGLAEQVREEVASTVYLVIENGEVHDELFGDDRDPTNALRDFMREGAALDRHAEDLRVLGLLERRQEHIRALPKRYQCLRGLLRRNHPLSPRAAAFIASATELYLWGFGAQCVVYCAAAMEAALTRCSAEWNDTDSQGRRYAPRLSTLIKEVLGSRPEIKMSAESLREARNRMLHSASNLASFQEELLHGDPAAAVVDAETALATLVLILDYLWPWEAQGTT